MNDEARHIARKEGAVIPSGVCVINEIRNAQRSVGPVHADGDHPFAGAHPHGWMGALIILHLEREVPARMPITRREDATEFTIQMPAIQAGNQQRLNAHPIAGVGGQFALDRDAAIGGVVNDLRRRADIVGVADDTVGAGREQLHAGLAHTFNGAAEIDDHLATIIGDHADDLWRRGEQESIFQTSDRER